MGLSIPWPGRDRYRNIPLYADEDNFTRARRLVENEDWAAGFDPQSQSALIVRIDSMRQRHVQWVVKTRRNRLDPAGSGFRSVLLTVARFPDFPTAEQIEAEAPEWGGGQYEIWTATPSKWWHQFQVDGDPLDPQAAALPKRKGGKNGVSFDANEWLEAHPDVRDSIAPAMIAKDLGLKPKDLTPRGQAEGDEDLENDPAIKGIMARNPKMHDIILAKKAALKLGGRWQEYMPEAADDETDPLTKLMRERDRRRMEKMLEELDEEEEGGGGRKVTGGNVLGEVIRTIAEKTDLSPLIRALSRHVEAAAPAGVAPPAETPALTAGTGAVADAPRREIIRPVAGPAPAPAQAAPVAEGQAPLNITQETPPDMTTVANSLAGLDGPSYAAIFSGKQDSDGNWFEFPPAPTAEEALARLQQYMPEGKDPMAWLLSVKWGALKQRIETLTSQKFAEVLWDEAAKDDEKSEVLLNVLGKHHPRTLLVLLQRVAAHPMVHYLPGGGDMKGAATLLLTTKARYLAEVMALCHEGIKHAQRIQAEQERQAQQPPEDGGAAAAVPVQTPPRTPGDAAAAVPVRGATEIIRPPAAAGPRGTPTMGQAIEEVGGEDGNVDLT